MESRPSIERRALLVAPSYNGLPDHMKLPGASSDLQVMKKLTEKLHFDDVKEIVGDFATKENILQALDDLSVTAKPETIVLFYYSGHGYYLTCTKDEGLVPADGTEEKLSRSETDVCITGRDLLPLLDRLSRKRVKLTVIFDCCHSGQLYRVMDLRKSGCTNLIPRQVILEQSLTTKYLSANKSEETGYKKLLRGGWTPTEKDNFFYIAACSPVQLAFEELGKGGRLTTAIETVVNSLQSFENVSIQAFFRLIDREFKKNRWYEKQTPQLEGTSLNTELFGVNKVPSKQGFTVNEVNGDEVILDAGCLQNLRPGVYSVFETTVTDAGVNLGKESSDWLGTIDVTEGRIGRVETSGFILERNSDTHKKISHGCLAYLTTPSSLKHDVWVKSTPDDSVPEKNVQELMAHLENAKLLNVSTKPFKIEDEDLITISTELYPPNKIKRCWVARRSGNVIVPPLSLGQEETMARNLSRYLRHKLALDSAQSPKDDEELLKNVTVKVVKIEKVKPYRTASKEVRIQEGLQHGKDLYGLEDAALYPSLMSHSLLDPQMNKLKDESGDAFVFQVTNHNKKEEDTVHICVLFYQFDGAIKAIYPPKKGRTAELRGGDSAQDIFRVFIPYNSLRKMAQPDPTLPEPDEGIDTIVVYATSKPADFEALLQTAIETDPDLIARGKEEKAQALSDLTKFFAPMRKRCLEDQPDEEFKWVIEKREFAVVKNTTE